MDEYMRLLTMSEWTEVSKACNPKFVIKKPSSTGYFVSSVSEHYFRLIPASWGLQYDHMMLETTLLEEMINKCKK